MGKREGNPVFEANLAALSNDLSSGYDAGGKDFSMKKANVGKEAFLDDQV